MLQYTPRIKAKQPNCVISYIGHENDSSVTKREYTQKKRELKLDSIIEGVKYDENELPSYREEEIPTMSVKLYQKTVNLKTYSAVNPEQHKYVTWIQELESIALLNKRHSLISSVLDLSVNRDRTSIESVESFGKKVLSRMVTCGNYIAMLGRTGPGNIAYIGVNALQYLLDSSSFMSNVAMKTESSDRRYLGNVNGLECLVCKEIDPDTILIFRSPNTSSHESSLFLIEADWDENRWAIADCSNSSVYTLSFKIY